MSFGGTQMHRLFRHAKKRHLPALLIGLVGAVAVLTAAATPAVACWLPKPPSHDCTFGFGGSSPFHGSKTCSTPNHKPTPSHTVTPPATPTQTVTVPAPATTVTVPAPTTTVTSTVTSTPTSAAPSTSSAVAGVSTSRHAPATHGVQAVTDTPISAPPTAIPTGVTAGRGISTTAPLITEIAGAIGVSLLMLALVLSYRRRPGSHIE
jgi:hypothetical protein